MKKRPEEQKRGFRTGLGAVIIEAPPGRIRVSGIVRWSCHFGRDEAEDGVPSMKAGGRRILGHRGLPCGMADREFIGRKWNQIHSIGESPWIMHQSAARDSIQIWMLIGTEGERALRSTGSRSRSSTEFCMDTGIHRLISGLRVEHTCQTNLTNGSNL